MILLAIFLGLTTIFTGSDLYKAQKELKHQQEIQIKTIEACGEVWLKSNQPIEDITVYYP